LLHLLTLTIWH